MSPTEPTVESLQAEIDKLNALIKDSSTTTTADTPTTTADTQTVQPTHGPSVQRETASGATVIGAAADPRGGTVVAYSDGTVKLFGVPKDANDNTAEGWGSAPEAEYVAFYTSNSGNAYNFVEADGTVVTVDNPVSNNPPGV